MRHLAPYTTSRLNLYLFILCITCTSFFAFPTIFNELYEPLRPSHATMHLLVEMLSIFISMSIAIHGWITFKNGNTHFPIVLAAAFFSVGILDTFHALTFSGMPLLFIESTPLTSTWFWILARLTESMALAFVFFMPKHSIRIGRNTAFITATVYSILILATVFTFYQELPLLILNGAPTLFKNLLELVTVILHIVVVLYCVSNVKKFHDVVIRNLYIIGSFSMALASIFFVQYKAVDAYLNMAGHLFKVIWYSMFFIVLFIVSVQAPFRKINRLHDRNRMMFNMLELGIIETDAKGQIQYVNMAANELLDLPSQSTDLLNMGQFESKATIGEVYEEITSFTGEKIPVEIDRFPLIENRQIVGYFYTLRDLREAIENERLVKEKLVTDFEIETAAAVQKDFSSQISSGDQIGFVSFPFKRLNGDFYNIVKQGNKTMITIADISGKGIPAAIQTSLIIGAIEHVNLSEDKPEKMVEFINRIFYKYSKSEHFMTLFTLIYDESTHMLEYCSAGHDPSLLYHSSTDTFTQLETKGAAIGFFEHAKFQSKSIQLQEKDLVILYTDGLIEDRQKLEGDLMEDLMNSVRHSDLTLSADTISKNCVVEVEKHRMGNIHDDRTLIVLKI